MQNVSQLLTLRNSESDELGIGWFLHETKFWDVIFCEKLFSSWALAILFRGTPEGCWSGGSWDSYDRVAISHSECSA